MACSGARDRCFKPAPTKRQLGPGPCVTRRLQHPRVRCPSSKERPELAVVWLRAATAQADAGICDWRLVPAPRRPQQREHSILTKRIVLLPGRRCLPAEHVPLLQHPHLSRRTHQTELSAWASTEAQWSALQGGAPEVHQQHPPVPSRMYPRLGPAAAFSPEVSITTAELHQKRSLLPGQDAVSPHHC